MSLERKTYDVAGLATAMLDDVKAHCRVDFADDDDYLEKATARAIGLIERTTSFSIAPATWLWTPAGLAPNPFSMSTSGGYGREGSNRCTCRGAEGWPGLQIPVCPISKFTAELTAADGTTSDVSASYQLVGTVDPSQFERQWLVVKPGVTVAPGSVAVTLTAGYAGADELAPGVEDIVLRMTAYLYENREFASIDGFDAPAYAASISTGLWIPAC
jgi:hypothetical protein